MNPNYYSSSTKNMSTAKSTINKASPKELFLGVGFKDEDWPSDEQLSRRRFKDTKSVVGTKGGIPSTCKSADELARSKLYSLQHKAMLFKQQNNYGPHKEEQFLFWPGGFQMIPNSSITYGISWVGVNVAGPTWVAAIEQNEAQVSVHTILTASLAHMTTGEDMFRPPEVQAGPFAVVSVAPYESLELTSEQRECASLAINFLKEKLEGHSHLPSEQVKQLAVFALELLMGKKYTSDAVEVAGFGFGKGNWGYFVGKMSDFDPVCFD